jgi:hypothetical protein
MLIVFRPSFEVVKEGRIFLIEKKELEIFLPPQEHSQINNEEV